MWHLRGMTALTALTAHYPLQSANVCSVMAANSIRPGPDPATAPQPVSVCDAWQMAHHPEYYSKSRFRPLAAPASTPSPPSSATGQPGQLLARGTGIINTQVWHLHQCPNVLFSLQFWSADLCRQWGDWSGSSGHWEPHWRNFVPIWDCI